MLPRDEYGCYFAKYVFNNKSKKSTFFPDHWDRLTVLKKVNEAYKNPIKLEDNILTGVTQEGMKIIQKSIRNISNDFVELENLLDDADYTVSVYATIFEYSFDNEPFSIESLKSIFSDKSHEIRGCMDTTSWNSAYEKIHKHLSYATYLHGIKKDQFSNFKITSNEMLQERLNIFMNIIKKHMAIPPQKTIEFLPVCGSYFGDEIIWNFCYIFLKDGKGVVLHAGASD